MDGKRRILYLGYWGIGDVLTASSVLPTLRALSAMENVSEVVFCSIERNGPAAAIDLPPKVKHIPLYSRFGKLYDFVVFPMIIWQLMGKYNINTAIGRSSLAGGMMLQVAALRKIPIIVESFEPHADYMVESDIWERDAFRTRWTHRMESKLKSRALHLLPVSENYKEQLIHEKVSPNRISVVPCTVRPDQFSFDENARVKIRRQLAINNLVVGIYIGKFGGIYYEQEAFEQFRAAFSYFGGRFAMIILTAQANVPSMLKQYMSDVDQSRVKILSVPHNQVPDYLSAADFAFSTIKPAPSRRFCSPIKHGEYWANGLPILVEEGIGDDSDIIAREGGGVILYRPAYRGAFEKIDAMIKQGRSEIYSHIRGLAIKYRNEKFIESTYRSILR